MDLLRTLTNHDFDVLATSLVRLLRSSPPGAPPARETPHLPPRRARMGSVDRAVLHVLELADGPLHVSAVHAEIERHTAESVNYASVKSCLARLASGASPSISRLSRGLYGESRPLP